MANAACGQMGVGACSSRFQRLGEPSIHLSYTRGIQDYEAAGGEKGGRDPRSREAYYLQRGWNSKRGRAFPTESGVQIWIPRTGKKLQGVVPLQALHDGILPPPAHPTLFILYPTQTQVQATNTRAIAS